METDGRTLSPERTLRMYILNVYLTHIANVAYLNNMGYGVVLWRGRGGIGVTNHRGMTWGNETNNRQQQQHNK